MTTRKSSDNSLLTAIYDQVTTLTSEFSVMKNDMVEVKEQVKYTNGKVARLIEKDIRRDEREKVEAQLKQPPIQHVERQENTIVTTGSLLSDRQKNALITAVVTIVTGVGAILTWVAAKLAGGGS